MDPVYYSADFPFHDFIENYAEVFDSLTVSFFGVSEFDLSLQRNNGQHTRVRTTADVDLLITRDHALPKKWMYGEVGWGSQDGIDGGIDELHFAWASTLFGMDHSRGLLLWQAKGNEGSRAGIWNQNGSVNANALEAWRVMGPVIHRSAEFLGTYHTQMNGDGLATDDNTLFAEDEATVLTRKLAEHVVIYSEGPTELSSSQVDPYGLSPLYSGGTPPSVSQTTNSITIGNLTPLRLYILQIVSSTEQSFQLPGDCNQDAALDLSDAVCALGVLFTGTPAFFPCGDGSPNHPANITLIDWQRDGAIDLSDAVGMLQFLFLGAVRHPLAVPGTETTECVAVPGCDTNLDCP